jgi:hypothetical protein
MSSPGFLVSVPSLHPPAPAAKRAQLLVELRWMMTRFLLFNQTQDTTAWIYCGRFSGPDATRSGC